MKKTLLLLAGIVIVLMLAFRLAYVKMNGGMTERIWYTQHLQYDFSAKIDSVIMLKGNVGLGKIICSLTRGNPNPVLEDSLNRHLTHHKTLRLLLPAPKDKVEFIFMGAERLAPGDSVIVNSQGDAIQFFRNGTMVYINELSTTLEARGNPFTF